MTRALVSALALTAAAAAGESWRRPLPQGFDAVSGHAGVEFVATGDRHVAAFHRDHVTFYAASPTGEEQVLSVRLAGARVERAPRGEGSPTLTAVRYVGPERASLETRTRHEAIRYANAYPGVDWLWQMRDGALEFRFKVAPGARPDAIRLHWEGATEIVRSEDGCLLVNGSSGLNVSRPEAWQVIGGERHPVTIDYRMEGADTVSFDIGPYRADATLHIDPILRSSRVLGGSAYDTAYAVAVDASNNAYVTGETGSLSFTSTGARYTRAAFVSKLSADGTQTLFTTILASGGNDSGRAIALDSGGRIWVAGIAGGGGFPVTTNAYSARSAGAEDAFLARLDSNGGLLYSTYFGGGGRDAAQGLAVDSAGTVYLAGYTASTNFPVSSGAPQRAYAGNNDAFLAKFSADGRILVYSTLLGGTGNDIATAVGATSTGVACLAGRTDSPNMPLRSAQQGSYAGNGDALVACLNSGGTAWSTVGYVGGTGSDEADAIALDASGNIYLAGGTFSLASTATGSYDAFLVKIGPTGTVAFSTTFGGAGSDLATGVGLDSLGRPWVAGYTSSIDFPATSGTSFHGAYDAFLTQFNTDGKPASSVYIGGAGDDRGYAVAIAGNGEVVVAGVTSSADFPVTSGSIPGGYNGFVTRWKSSNSAPAAGVSPGSGTGSQQTFTVTLTDPDGQSDIAAAYLLLLNGTTACFVEYLRSVNQLWLHNDAGNGWLTAVTPGVAGTLSNSQCVLDGGASSVIASGNTVILRLALTFRTSFSGTKTLYAVAFDAGGLDSGWQPVGAWTVPSGNHPPTITSVTPAAGSGHSQAFAITISDPEGQADITALYFLVNGPTEAGCFIEYYRPVNQFWLRNNANTGWIPGPIPGGPGTASNSQCLLDGPSSTISASGSELVVRINLTFQTGYSGVKIIYTQGFDAGGLSTGWQTIGTWTVPGVNHPPTLHSVSPSSGSGLRQTFTVTMNDPDGNTDLAAMYFLVNSTSLAGCFIEYHRALNQFWLRDDAGASWLSGPKPGAAGTVSNGQCTLDGPTSAVTASGETLVVQIGLTFRASYSGVKTIYAAGFDNGGMDTGFQTIGSWTVR